MPSALSINDRNSIQQLHPTSMPSSVRDASGSGPWKNPPTIIQEPTNNSRTLGSNPFSGRMKDNLSNRSTNKVANAVLFGISSGSGRLNSTMPKKHQRKTISSTFSPEDQPHRPPGTSATNRRKDQLLVAKEPPPTHYISDSSDEDLGEPLQATSAPSPDQLDSFQTPQTTRQDNKATILKPLSILPSHARAKSPRPEAGSSRSSPIECYDDDGDEDERPKPTGLVQQRVHDIEKNSGPRLNLLHAQNPGPKKTAKERMRSKQVGKTFEEVITTSPRHPSEPNDPVATSSTAFIHIDKGKGKEPARKPPVDDTIILPVEEWCLGKLYMPNQCIILYEPDRPAFSVAYEDVTEMARFGLLKEVQWAESKSFFCVQMVFKPMRPQTLGVNYPKYFHPGENGGLSCLTFKLNTKHESWSKEGWNAFIKKCKEAAVQSRPPLTGDPSVEALWNNACSRTSHRRGAKPTADNGQDRVSPYFNGVTARSHISSREHTNGRETSNRIRRGPITYSTSESRKRNAPPSPSDTAESQTDGLRRSTRNIGGFKRKSPSADPEEVILSYPPNAPGAVNITNADLGRLEPSEYLNDTLIEFGLKLWHKELEDSNPEVAQKIHIFNSFFYKKLNKKNVEEGFQSVRRWTSKFDIFQKEYVIIPINENLHWYLAIIHQPGNILLPPPEKEPPTVRRSSRKFNANEAAEKAEEDSDRTLQNADTKAEDTMSIQMEDKDTIGDDESAYDMDLTIPASASVSTDIHSDTENVNILDTSGMHMEVDGDGNSSDSVSAQLTNGINDGMDLDGADNDITMVDGDDGQKHEAESPIPPESFYAKPPSRKGKEKAEPDDSVDGEDMSNVHLSQPAAYIITLDSLGTQHRKVCRVLGEYLKLEAKDKHQNENTTKPISKSASVPPQPNFSDCGLYLLHFARVFVEKTDYLMRVIQRGHRTVAERRQDWNESDVASQRERLAEKIRELSKPWKEQRMAQLEEEKKKKAKTDAEQAVAVEDSSDSDLDIVEGVTISRTNSTSSAKGGKGSNKKKRKAASRLRG